MFDIVIVVVLPLLDLCVRDSEQRVGFVQHGTGLDTQHKYLHANGALTDC